MTTNFLINNNPDNRTQQDILQMENNGVGLPAATPQAVRDGLGNSSPLQLSQTTVNINSGFQIGGVAVNAPGIVNCTASTLALTAALHAGKYVTLNRAAGIAVTLPAATGTGNVYRLIVGTTFTGASSIAVVDSTDYMIGTASLGIDGGTAVPHQYPTANSGTLATESDTLSLFGTANSQGGIKGQLVELVDIATDIWFVRTSGDAGGTEATPFSAAV